MGVRRIGHGGTLDPGATGLLVIFVGRATRLAEYLGGGVKQYDATIRFGVATDTEDADGEEIETAPVPHVGLEEMTESRKRFLGQIEQVPPAYSAVHVGGSRAYKVARRGQEINLQPRTVRIEAIEVLGWRPPDLDVRVTCHGGTYVRSLARDWGRSLGSVAHVARLRRERSEPFDVRDTLTLEDVERRVAEGSASSVIASPLPALVAVLGRTAEIEPRHARQFARGAAVPFGSSGEAMAGTDRVVVTSHGAFVGLAEVRRDRLGAVLEPRVVWSPA